MRSKRDAIEHCQRHIERAEAELEKRQAAGRDTERVRRHLNVLKAVQAAHTAECR